MTALLPIPFPVLVPTASPSAADEAAHADGRLLTAMKLTAGGLSTEICREVIGPLLVRQRAALGGLLRAAAVAGLDPDAAVQVGAQIDAALAATKTSASFQPPAIRAFRDEGGSIVFDCRLDRSAVSVSIDGDGYHASSGKAESPDWLSFGATVGNVPSSRPTFVMQPVAAAAPVVNVNQGATKQTITRDEDGEIKQILTTPAQ